MLIDFAPQPKGLSLLDSVMKHRQEEAQGKSAVDFALHAIVMDAQEGIFSELPALIKAGVPTIKIFMAYKGTPYYADDSIVFRMLQRAKVVGALICVHAENADVIDVLQKQLVAAKKTEPKYHATSRPAAIEAEATSRATLLAKVAEAPVFIVHISCAEAMWAMNFDPNLHHDNGYTPLAYAAMKGNPQMVELFVRHGADPAMTTREGDTAVELALRMGHTEVADTLKRARQEMDAARRGACHAIASLGSRRPRGPGGKPGFSGRTGRFGRPDSGPECCIYMQSDASSADMSAEALATPIAPQAICRDALLEKYAKGTESTVEEVRRRVARALAQAEPEAKRALWERRFLETLQAGFIPAGRINSAAGVQLQATLINCFVQPVGDSIAAVLVNAAAYFDVHHSALDTLTSVHPRELELQAVISPSRDRSVAAP